MGVKKRECRVAQIKNISADRNQNLLINVSKRSLQTNLKSRSYWSKGRNSAPSKSGFYSYENIFERPNSNEEEILRREFFKSIDELKFVDDVSLSSA